MHFISDDNFLGFIIRTTLIPVKEIEAIMTTSVPYKNNDAKARAIVPHFELVSSNRFELFSCTVYNKTNIMCIDYSHKMRIRA
ncbi:MAG: hypothetical protein K8Q89_06330 [Nitrosarchaeum sp.]|nr:hypothetical protein [Nitrosarchaeum sp.]